MDGDIEARHADIAGKLDANLTALDAIRAGLAEVIDAIAGGKLVERRLARSLANFDGLIARLGASASGLEGLDAALGLTAAEVREVRRQERERLRGQSRQGDGRQFLRAVGD